MVQFGAILVPDASLVPGNLKQRLELGVSEVLAGAGEDCDYQKPDEAQTVPHHVFEGRDAHVAGELADRKIPYLAIWDDKGDGLPAESMDQGKINDALKALVQAIPNG